MSLKNHQTQCIAAADDYRMGRCSEAQYRAQLGRLGFTASMQDREVASNQPCGQFGIGRAKITGSMPQNKS